jgi:hypothetical protein
MAPICSFLYMNTQNLGDLKKKGMLMIVYHGSIRKFEQFHKETVVQHLPNDIDTIGFWFTSDIDSAKP